MSRIVSMRGLLEHNDIERINLQRNNGLTGYRIKKFEVFPEKPGTSTAESLFQVFSIEASASAQVGAVNVNFSDNTLLAVGFVGASTNNTQLAPIPAVVFDNITFNQDIFILYTDESANNTPSNYHIELEQFDLALDEQTVATLKDIRNVGTQ